MKKLLSFLLFLIVTTGCSSPSYYTYEGASKDWEGKLEFVANESTNQAEVTLELDYIGKNKNILSHLSYELELIPGNQISFYENLPDQMTPEISQTFDKITLPSTFPKEYKITISTNEKSEELSLFCKRVK